MTTKRTKRENVMERVRNNLTQIADLQWRVKDTAAFEYLKAATFTANTRKATIAEAEKCGSDRWVVVQARPRKWALFTGDNIHLIPKHVIPIKKSNTVD
jgi:hypothetical protein